MPACSEAEFDFISKPQQAKIMKNHMNHFVKTPYEIISLPFSFTPALNDAETISSYTIVCINIRTGVDTKATIISSDTNDSTSVTAVIQAGTAKDCHKITVRVLSSAGDYFEIDLLLDILETITDKFKKQPGSKYTISNDFGNNIASSDSIASETITVIKISDGSDVTGDIFVSSCTDGTSVYFTLQGGVNGQDYIVSVKIITTDGLRNEKFILMSVEEV